MLALTLWRPWALAVVAGPKDLENRPWSPRALKKGEVFAIHAGATFDADALPLIRSIWPACPTARHEHPTGIVGLAEYLGADGPLAQGGNPWAFGPVCWKLGVRLALPEPLLCSGARSLWPVPEQHLAALEAAWAARPR